MKQGYICITGIGTNFMNATLTAITGLATRRSKTVDPMKGQCGHMKRFRYMDMGIVSQ